MTKFLFDTYALIEIINKNPKFEPYLDDSFIINEFIFAEYCYHLVQEKLSQELIDEVIPSIVHPNPKIIEKAMQWRSLNKKKNMSMTDCISYIMAKEMKIKFLTGDKEFEFLDNVEFVKK